MTKSQCEWDTGQVLGVGKAGEEEDKNSLSIYYVKHYARNFRHIIVFNSIIIL